MAVARLLIGQTLLNLVPSARKEAAASNVLWDPAGYHYQEAKKKHLKNIRKEGESVELLRKRSRPAT
jgi:hypothetical protein